MLPARTNSEARANETSGAHAADNGISALEKLESRLFLYAMPTVTMVRDINLGPGDTHPAPIEDADSVVHRVGNLGDSTTKGTRRLTDIDPGPGDGIPNNLSFENDRLFFFAQDPDHGRELRMARFSHAMVSGVAFADTNGNGRLDTGERRISGCTVRLDDGRGGSALTDASGNYSIDTVGGAHALSIRPPPGYRASISKSVSLQLLPGDSARRHVPLTDRASHSGVVFRDNNVNEV